MSSGENIRNAFEVVIKTYNSANKLLSFCQKSAEEKGEFATPLDKILYYKRDSVLTGYITLFQSTDDDPLDYWYDGPLYVLDINLYDPPTYEVPTANIARFEYDDISSWSDGCKQSSCSRILNPLYGTNMNYEMDADFYLGEVSDIETADNEYWGLRKIVGFSIPLTDITSETAYEKIFGGFKKINELYPIETATVRTAKIKPVKGIRERLNQLKSSKRD